MRLLRTVWTDSINPFSQNIVDASFPPGQASPPNDSQSLAALVVSRGLLCSLWLVAGLAVPHRPTLDCYSAFSAFGNGHRDRQHNAVAGPQGIPILRRVNYRDIMLERLPFL